MSSKPTERIGAADLWLGDSIEILPALTGIDAVVTDPPYEAEAHTEGRRLNGRTLELRDKRVREIDPAPLSFAPMTEHTRTEVSKLFARLCRGWVLVFCQAEAVAAWRDSLAEAGARYRRAMIWVKPDSAPQLSGDRPAMGYESIVAAWAGQGPSAWNGGGRRGVFTFGKHDPGMGHGGPTNDHQTQKPIALMRELVGLFSNQAETVLDPFMGSGTTGVACAKLGRKFIGIEIEQRYFDIACRRIEDAYKQPDLFIAPAPEPEQIDIRAIGAEFEEAWRAIRSRR